MAIIDKPSDYFNTKLYTGTGSTLNITGVGFQPDLVWTKGRDSTAEGVMDHALVDSVRGVTKTLRSNTTGAEGTEANSLTAFGSDGYTVGANGKFNYSSSDIYVSWNWLGANGTAANTDGTISSTVSANTTSGFSIVSYTGTGANATVGHGLGSAPRMMIFKNRDRNDEGWIVYHESIGNTKRLLLDETAVVATSSTFFQDTSPTSSIITLGSNHGTNGPHAMICYAFAEKQGFSKFGSYTGNGNADGTFVYTGFKPAFIIIKGAVSGNGNAAQSWELYDNKRLGYNVDNNSIFPNTNSAESTGDRIDILSNGFKIRINSDGVNDNNSTYIYMAFAEQPLVGDNPATAR
jgi:hypothetical protein